jgi:hypothetical protein
MRRYQSAHRSSQSEISMKNDNAAGGASVQAPGSGDEQFPAAFLEHATEALEAISSLMEKIGSIGERGGLDDAQMLEELRKSASTDAEKNILSTVLEMATLLRGAGDAPESSAESPAQDQPASRSGGRFHDLV